jgi:hypothetical protein
MFVTGLHSTVAYINMGMTLLTNQTPVLRKNKDSIDMVHLPQCSLAPKMWSIQVRQTVQTNGYSKDLRKGKSDF